MFAFERDEFASVVDRLGDSVDGDLPGLLFEAESVLLLNGGEGLPVGFETPSRCSAARGKRAALAAAIGRAVGRGRRAFPGVL